MGLRELRAQLAQVKSQGNEILNKAETENRELSNEELDTLEDLKAKGENLSSKISQLEKAQDLKASFDDIKIDIGEDLNSQVLDFEKIEVGNRREDLDQTFGFKDVCEFSSAVKRGSLKNGAVIDQRLRVDAGPTGEYHSNVANEDGFVVPPQYSNRIWKMVNEKFSLHSKVHSEPTKASQINDNADESTPWGATGVKAFWEGEAEKLTPSKQKLNPRMTVLYKLHAYVEATEELIEDTPRLESRLYDGAAAAISWQRDYAIISGTGVGQPEGYMNSKALVKIAKEAGQTNQTITALNIAKMYARLLSHTNALWLVNPDCLPQLITLTLNDNPLYITPQSGFINAPDGFLFGKPVMFTDHAETLGDEGDIQLINPRGYYSPRRSGGPKFASSMHLLFDYDMRAFRWTFREGGRTHLSKPVNPAKGNKTRSDFVVLQDRK